MNLPINSVGRALREAMSMAEFDLSLKVLSLEQMGILYY